MNTIRNTFTFTNEVTDNYIEELQNAFNKLEDLLNHVGKYNKGGNDEDVPIWEYVEHEDENIIFAIVNLFTGYMGIDKEGIRTIINSIHEAYQNYEE